MNDYQNEPLAERGADKTAAMPGDPLAAAGQPGPSPAPAYAARAAEEERRYRALKAACACPSGAGLALGGLALGVLAVEMLLLYPSGLSVLLLAAGLQALLFSFYRERAGRDFYLLGGLILLMAAGYPLHDTPSTRPICALGLCAAAALQLASLDSRESPLSAETLLHIPGRLLAEPVLHLGLPFSAVKGLRSGRSQAVRAAAAILLGLALALPVSGALLVLFSLADAAFGEAVERFFESLWLSPASIFCDVLLGGTLGLLLAARLLKARFAEAAQPVAEKRALPRIPALVSGAFLGSICTVTLLFVCFQFAYLFGGEGTRAAFALTYSDYARRGFFELCAASALIFVSALFALLFTRPGEKGVARGVRGLVVALCAGDFVILLSAFCRMRLYIAAYGLSVRRLLTLWGMAVIAAGLVLLILWCFTVRFCIVRALLITGLAALCCLSLCNPERVAASWNVRQMAAGTIPFDTGCFGELGFTAAPQLEKLAEAFPEKSEEIDELLSRMCRRYESGHPLYSFSLDRPGAKAVFDRRLVRKEQGASAEVFTGECPGR